MVYVKTALRILSEKHRTTAILPDAFFSFIVNFNKREQKFTTNKKLVIITNNENKSGKTLERND
jgi:hypothetical protein